jgi:DNA repair protein RadC
MLGRDIPDGASTRIRGPEDVVAFLRCCEVATDVSAQIVLGLALSEDDPRAHVVCGAAVRTGTDARRAIDRAQLVDLAEELMVCAVVIATVGAEGSQPPSRADIRRFATLRRRCADDGVALLDWLMITAGHWWSLRERVIHEAA